MASFTQFLVTPRLDQQSPGFDLHWSYLGGGQPTFSVMAAEALDGDWSQVASVTTPYALGVGHKQLSSADLQYFKIVATVGGQSMSSVPMTNRSSLSRADYLFYREHLRRLRLDLEKTPGSLGGWLLTRRTYGPPCAECCDELLGTPSSSECPVCYGTGIAGGYWQSGLMLADWAGGPPNASNTVKDSPGPTQVTGNQLWLFPYPPAKSEDVWMDAGTRYAWLVTSVDVQQFSGAPLDQTLTVSRLPPTHPVYQFPLA